jgi:hypothetical protein
MLIALIAALAFHAGIASLFAQQSKTGTASLAVQVAPAVQLTTDNTNAYVWIRLGTAGAGSLWGDSSNTCTSPIAGATSISASGKQTYALSTIPFISSNTYVCVYDPGPPILAAFASWPHTAASLKFGQQPGSTTAGASISPAVTVEVLDSNGIVDTASTASITLAIGTNPGGGTLSGTLTQAAVNGIATFNNLSINKAGTGYTLTATSSGLASATSSAFNISAGAATKLVYTTVPATGTAGTAFSVTVQSQDANSNPASPTSNTTITLSKASGGGTLSGTLTGTISTSGNSVTISTPVYSKADTMTLTATATAGETSLSTVTSGNIVFSAGAATQLVYTTQPGGGTGGTAWTAQPVVTVEDANGNTVTGSSASITLTITSGTPTSGGPGTLTCTTNPMTPNSGVATFTGCSINKVGTGYKLHASNGTLTNDSSALSITAGTAAKFVITGSGTQTAGATNNLTITAQDAGGNTATSYAGSHSLTFSGANPSTNPVTNPTVTNSSGTAINFGTATPVTFTNGVSSAGGVMTLYKTETAAVSVTDSSISSSGSLTVVVSAATARKLAWGVEPPGSVTRGVVISPAMTVLIEDPYGNTVNSTATVTLTQQLNGTENISPNSANAVAGTATFSSSIITGNKTGSDSITATSGTLTSADSTSFNVQ